MQKNLAQLSEYLELNEVGFIDECHRLSELFTKEFSEEGNHTGLLELNKELHRVIRTRLKEEKAANGISRTQSFYLIISLAYMLIVILLKIITKLKRKLNFKIFE